MAPPPAAGRRPARKFPLRTFLLLLALIGVGVLLLGIHGGDAARVRAAAAQHIDSTHRDVPDGAVAVAGREEAAVDQSRQGSQSGALAHNCIDKYCYVDTIFV